MPKRKRGNNEGSIYKMQDGRWRTATVATATDVATEAGAPKAKPSRPDAVCADRYL